MPEESIVGTMLVELPASLQRKIARVAENAKVTFNEALVLAARNGLPAASVQFSNRRDLAEADRRKTTGARSPKKAQALQAEILADCRERAKRSAARGARAKRKGTSRLLKNKWNDLSKDG